MFNRQTYTHIYIYNTIENSFFRSPTWLDCYMSWRTFAFHVDKLLPASIRRPKTALTHTHILVLPTVDDDLILDTDASNVGIGAVLSRTKDGKEQVIAFFSWAFSKLERNYCVTRKELLALVIYGANGSLGPTVAYEVQDSRRPDHQMAPEAPGLRLQSPLSSRQQAWKRRCNVQKNPVQKTSSTAQGPKRNKTSPTNAECRGQR